MSSPDLDDRQKAAIRWAEAVTLLTARDDDAAFAAMKRHFSEKQIVELTVFCGMWNYSNRLCEALHVDLVLLLTLKVGQRQLRLLPQLAEFWQLGGKQTAA